MKLGGLLSGGWFTDEDESFHDDRWTKFCLSLKENGHFLGVAFYLSIRVVLTTSQTEFEWLLFRLVICLTVGIYFYVFGSQINTQSVKLSRRMVHAVSAVFPILSSLVFAYRITIGRCGSTCSQTVETPAFVFLMLSPTGAVCYSCLFFALFFYALRSSLFALKTAYPCCHYLVTHSDCCFLEDALALDAADAGSTGSHPLVCMAPHGPTS
jgi:hypothetical protein